MTGPVGCCRLLSKIWAIWIRMRIRKKEPKKVKIQKVSTHKVHIEGRVPETATRGLLAPAPAACSPPSQLAELARFGRLVTSACGATRRSFSQHNPETPARDSSGVL